MESAILIFAVTVSSITSPACTSMHCSEHAHWMSTQSPEVAGDVITVDLCLGTQMKTGRGIATNVNTISVTNALVPIPGKKQVISEIPCETPLVEMSFNFLSFLSP